MTMKKCRQGKGTIQFHKGPCSKPLLMMKDKKKILFLFWERKNGLSCSEPGAKNLAQL